MSYRTFHDYLNADVLGLDNKADLKKPIKDSFDMSIAYLGYSGNLMAFKIRILKPSWSV